jgi:2-succinyl-6-hydroxy-2,4-cyclohexadiene-1-carboxylate synthase
LAGGFRGAGRPGNGPGCGLMARITANGVHLNVEMSGQGPPVVLLHGFTGSAESWRAHSAVLGQTFTTLAVELLGHGASDSPADPARFGMDQCAADLIAIFDHLGLARVNLLGYSMGGRVALHVAVAHPGLVATLILESASPGLAGLDERRARVASDEALANSIEQQGLEAFVDSWSRLPLFASQAALPEAVRADLRAQRLRNNPRGLANSLRGLGTGVTPPLWDRLQDVRCPTLVIAGALDTKYVAIAQAMAAGLAASRLAIVPEAGHAAHLEQPEAFDRLVLEFLVEHNAAWPGSATRHARRV